MNEKQSVSSDKPAPSALSRAVEHVKSNWIPFNRSILNQLKQSPTSLNTEERQATLALLRQDLGLFTYCLKELLLDPQSKSEGATVLPIDLLLSCPAEKLKAIITKAENEIFHQSQTESAEPRERVLFVPIVSAVISKTLAPSVDLDPETTFLTALLRQLGLALIAWNYPSLFTKALKRVGPGCSLEKALYLVLGYSSMSLSLSLAQSLAIPTSIRSAMGEDEKELRSRESARICKLGEALARSEEIWMDPAVGEIAKEAMREVEEISGGSGIEAIRKAIAQDCILLLDKVPKKLGHEKASTSPEGEVEKTITIVR